MHFSKLIKKVFLCEDAGQGWALILVAAFISVISVYVSITGLAYFLRWAVGAGIAPRNIFLIFCAGVFAIWVAAMVACVACSRRPPFHIDL